MLPFSLPLDFNLLSIFLNWMSKKLYYKLFKTKYAPIDYSDECINSESLKDVYYTGTITDIREDTAYIDARFTFNISQISQDVYIGNVVTCIVNSDRLGLFSDITVIDILNENENFVDASGIDSKAHGLIVKRVDRTFTVSPGPLEFNLDEVVTKFIPEVGDLVELHVCKDGNEDKVTHIFPQGYKVISGNVTSCESDVGFVNEKVIFQKYHCQPGYEPQKDDRVVVSVIRCQNGSTQFRALHVAPLVNSKKYHFSYPTVQSSTFTTHLLFLPKEVICVNLGEEKIIDSKLVNNSNTEYTLTKLKAFTAETFIELIEPSNIEVTLLPKSSLDLKFKVSVKYVGFSSVTLEFIFEDFVYECSLNVLAINKTNDLIVTPLDLNVANNNADSVRNDKRVLNFHDSNYVSKAPIPGRSFKKSIKFFPVKLGFYEIPKELVQMLKGKEKDLSVKTQVENCYPCLAAGLKEQNYKVYFHCLLYLEEVSIDERISKLQLTAGFDKRQDFMVLQIDAESNYTMLQPGDKVLARKPWQSDGDVFEGVIWTTSPREMFIKFKQSFHDDYISRSEYILTFSMSRSQMRLKHQAVDDVTRNLGIKWLFPLQTPFQTPFVIQVHNESEESSYATNIGNKRNTKWNRQGSGYGNRQQKVTLESTIPVSRRRVIKWFNIDLNEEQRIAVVNCLRAESRPYPYIIFGPPGTGKSMTLVELCLQIYKLIPESKILCVAPTNSAADQLSLNLIGSGFVQDSDFVRLGGHKYMSSGNIPEGLVMYTYLPDMRGEEVDEPDEVPKINRYCLSEKRLIISTLGSIGVLRTMGFPNGYFSHFIVDEAGQVMEPENLIIATLMSNDSQMILAGDPLQLGPVIFSNLAKNYGLHRSYLFRLMDFKPYLFDKLGFPNTYGYNPKFITKLVRSYRSLPKLLKLISGLFYRDELKPMIDENYSKEAAIYSTIKDIFPPESEIPILFHSVSGREVLEDGSFSFYNNEEVFQLCTYLSQLYRLGIQPHDVGIITPYIGQVRKITHYLDCVQLEVPKIGSVEEFQGQEKNVILLSTVRSSIIIDPNINQLSFIYSAQRINVAISRAKAALIIVGNSTTLSNDDTWRKIVKYVIDHKSFRR